MTFTNFIKLIITKQLNALTNSKLVKDLVIQETLSVRMAKQVTKTSAFKCCINPGCC